MSWDLVVFSFPDPESDPETGNAIIPDWGEAGPPVFATGHEIRNKICQTVPDFVWEDDPSEYEGSTGSIGIRMHDTDEPVSDFMLFCHGNPAQQVVQLAQVTVWNIYDLTSGKWMHDTDNPNQDPARHRKFVQNVATSASSRPQSTPKATVLNRMLGKFLKPK